MAGWKNPPIDFSFKALKDADQFTKRVTGNMLRQVVTRSPVDTGAFRSNHRVGVGHVNDKTDKNETDQNGALTQGLATIAQGGGIGKVVYISNSLPYSLKLENGHSKQAPLGVYALSFKSVVDSLK